MTDQRFPLSWPTNWPRTAPSKRIRAEFGQTRTTWTDATAESPSRAIKTVGAVGLAQAVMRLQAQLDKLGAKDLLLSTNVSLRLDGLPRAGQAEPSDTGAAVYFELKAKARVFACDKWTRVADNVAAIANHIDALRRIQRYGIGDLDQAFAGYVGLPAKGTTWKTTLGFAPDASPTADEIQLAFRGRARSAHPDAEDGSHDAMASLVSARDEGLAEVRGR